MSSQQRSEPGCYYTIQDEPLSRDPLFSEFPKLVKSQLNYHYHFNSTESKHVLYFTDIWRGYLPSQADFNHPLFKRLSDTRSGCTQDEIAKLCRTFKSEISFKERYSVNWNAKINVALFWVARALNAESTFWSWIYTNLDLITYDHNDEYPFAKVFNYLRKSGNGDRLFGTVCFKMPGLTSPNLAELTEEFIRCGSRQIVFFELAKFELVNLYQYPSAPYYSFHATFNFSTPHCSVFSSRNEFITYLLDKADETWNNCLRLVNNPGSFGSRILEGLAVFLDDIEVKTLSFAGMYLPLLSHLKRIEPTRSITSWIALSQEYLSHPNNFVAKSLFSSFLGKILMPSCMTAIHTTFPVVYYPHFIEYEYKFSELVRDISKQGSEEVMLADEYFKWIELPLMARIEDLYNIEELCEPLSTSNFKVISHSRPRCDLTDLLGQFSVFGTSVGTFNLNNALMKAKELYSAVMPDEIYCMKMRTSAKNYFPLLYSDMRKKIIESPVPTRIYSDKWYLQGLLFDEAMEKDSTTTVVSPTIESKISKLNNSSFKLFNCLISFLLKACEYNRDTIRYQNVSQDYQLSKVIFFGAVNEPVADAIRRLFPNLNVKAVGADAIGPNERSGVIGSITRNMSCDILISDIDQTGAGSFEEMVDTLLEQIHGYISWSDNVIVKVNYPSSFLLNTIKQMVIDSGFKHRINEFCVAGQNGVTSECFLILSTHLENFAEYSEDLWFSEYSPAVQRYRSLYLPERGFPIIVDKNVCLIPGKENMAMVMQPGTLVGITVPSYLAHLAITLSLETCCPVYSWKTDPSVTSVVHIVGVPSRSRMAICSRTPQHYFIESGKTVGTEGAFGISRRPPNIPRFLVTDWSFILCSAMRQYLLDLGFGMRPGCKRIVSIGTRNLTDVVVNNDVKILCYDKYYVFSKLLSERYNIIHAGEFFDYAETALLENTVYLANFSLMAPEGLDPPSSDAQLAKIELLISRLANKPELGSCFVWNLYSSNFITNFMKSVRLPKGLGLVVGDTSQVRMGGYRPCATIDAMKCLDLIKKYKRPDYVGGVSYLPYDSMLKSCVDNMMLPDADGGVSLLTACRISYACWFGVGTPESRPIDPENKPMNYKVDDMNDNLSMISSSASLLPQSALLRTTRSNIPTEVLQEDLLPSTSVEPVYRLSDPQSRQPNDHGKDFSQPLTVIVKPQSEIKEPKIGKEMRAEAEREYYEQQQQQRQSEGLRLS